MLTQHNPIDMLDRLVELEFQPPEGGIAKHPSWETRWLSQGGLAFIVQVAQTDEGYSLTVGKTEVSLAVGDGATLNLTRKRKFGQPALVVLPIEANALEALIESGNYQNMVMTAEDCLTQAVVLKLHEIVVADANGDIVKPSIQALVEDAAIESGVAVAQMKALQQALSLLSTDYALPTTPNGYGHTAHVPWQTARDMMHLHMAVHAFSTEPELVFLPEKMLFFLGKCFELHVAPNSATIVHRGETQQTMTLTILPERLKVVWAEREDGALEELGSGSLAARDVRSGAWQSVFNALGLKPGDLTTPALMLRCVLERFQQALVALTEVSTPPPKEA